MPGSGFNNFWRRYGVQVTTVIGVIVGLVSGFTSPPGFFVVGFCLGLYAFYMIGWRPFYRDAMTRSVRAAEQRLRDVPISVEFRTATQDGEEGYHVAIVANANLVSREEVIQVIGGLAEALKRGQVDRIFRMEKPTPRKGSDSSLN
jgi:hypothetical protein